jgi:hypothetical protein
MLICSFAVRNSHRWLKWGNNAINIVNNMNALLYLCSSNCRGHYSESVYTKFYLKNIYLK